ncbi:MAG: hypothetical protein A2V77_23175 [Anaeromyxobacter sp. RBG_16_69_14]|nr:MAG: hypothetical protein A2V77_23175 [Anaeromyxobacter sp. RBG_16_69_14]
MTWTASASRASGSTRAEATFRTLALDGGADNAQIDAITHPRLVTGPDFYRRLERGWEDGAPAARPS